MVIVWTEPKEGNSKTTNDDSETGNDDFDYEQEMATLKKPFFEDDDFDDDLRELEGQE